MRSAPTLTPAPAPTPTPPLAPPPSYCYYFHHHYDDDLPPLVACCGPMTLQNQAQKHSHNISSRSYRAQCKGCCLRGFIAAPRLPWHLHWPQPRQTRSRSWQPIRCTYQDSSERTLTFRNVPHSAMCLAWTLTSISVVAECDDHLHPKRP